MRAAPAFVGLMLAPPSACECESRVSPAESSVSSAPSATDDEDEGSTATASQSPSTPASAPPVRRDNTVYGSSELMGTRVSINVWLADTDEAARAGSAMQAALTEMARIESIMSEWQAGSELSRLSAAAGGPVRPISPELFEVLARSREIAELTDGAFDPTFHGVGQLWSFRPGSEPPDRTAVAAKLPLVDWRQLELDEAQHTAVLRRPDMKLGLGAIAKGYAVDRASAVLRELGFAHHVVEAGGDTYASGTKAGQPWRVGVQHPSKRGVVGIVHARDLAVVTSGNYQRFFEHGGVRYSHILDPRTGWPIASERAPQSVTVVAPDATSADALGTALAVMGTEAALRFVSTRAEIDAIIVDHDGQVHGSAGLGQRYQAVTSAVGTAK